VFFAIPLYLLPIFIILATVPEIFAKKAPTPTPVQCNVQNALQEHIGKTKLCNALNAPKINFLKETSFHALVISIVVPNLFEAQLKMSAFLVPTRLL